MASTTNSIPVPGDLIDVDPSTDEVCCDGGNGALGHPHVWYTFDEGARQVTCLYCDRVFVKMRA
jgi:uncharacterized Zn-finger protein